MQKRRYRGRSEFLGIDLQAVLQHSLTDASRYLGDELAGSLLGSLNVSVSEYRDRLSEALSHAESRLALGDGVRYIALRQLEALLKKNGDWCALSAEQRRKNALDKFLLSEEKCKRTNKRLKFYREHWSRGQKTLPMRCINQASLICQEILGILDHDIQEEILESARFGSGATFRHGVDERSPYYKLSGRHTVTEEAIPLLREWMARSPRIHSLVSNQTLEVVKGNRLSFVPKDWDIDRTIAIEPSWNIFLQLGVNGILTRRLKSFGITLKDQTRNWPQAKEGSISHKFATIDLSSASDTVATELVKKLLPGGWFKLLDALRSKAYTLDKGQSWHEGHKFSSMGNGFTFPLESLVFYALTRATASVLGLDSSGIRVYGDDIICPQQLYAPLVEVLRFAGFDINDKKSFNHGPFRETCGRDYLCGVNVRPVYLRKTPTNVEDIYSLYNRLYLFSMLPLPSVLRYLRSCIRNPLSGPISTSDGNLCPQNFVDTGNHRWGGASLRLESYFCTISPDNARRGFDVDLQCFVFHLSILDRKVKEDKNAKDPYLRYLLFLLGVTGGRPLSPNRVRWFERDITISYWPDHHDYLRLRREVYG